jgi:hypothetical protein
LVKLIVKSDFAGRQHAKTTSDQKPLDGINALFCDFHMKLALNVAIAIE